MTNRMLTIIDNVLDADNLQNVQNYFSEESARSLRWVDGSFESLIKENYFLSELLKQAELMFDLSPMVGIEQWSHYGNKLDWHVDKDELLAERTGEIACPICSIVLYANVNNLVGGNFMMTDVHITPKTNRMLVFGSNILHGVDAWNGTRMSVAVNPWANKPMGYEDNNVNQHHQTALISYQRQLEKGN